jgi:hypothetical protein
MRLEPIALAPDLTDPPPAAMLSAARAQLSLTGNRFGEWGSGLGLVTCLASRRGWAACGIERDAALVAATRRLAADHGCPVRFLEGSYAPEGFRDGAVGAEAAHRRIGDTALFDFDLIYAYAWPAEAEAIRALFATHAAPGTILLLYRGGLQIEALRAA